MAGMYKQFYALHKNPSKERLPIQAYFRRIKMELAEHDNAYISPPICTNRLIFGR